MIEGEDNVTEGSCDDDGTSERELDGEVGKALDGTEDDET